MKIAGQHYRTIWLAGDGRTVEVIDQTRLPFDFAVLQLRQMEEMAQAIERMVVRGAPLIGVSAAYGIALAMAEDSSDGNLVHACQRLLKTRPTAVNLRWALERAEKELAPLLSAQRAGRAYKLAAEMCDEDVNINQRIGQNGTPLIEAAAALKNKGDVVNILTHCNAGWLATVDWGTATAPIYMAHNQGLKVHVWVDETRPRNQGASLTAYELGHHGVPHTVIADNVGGHLMQHGMVDMVIVGTDRTTRTGDVANKIGTYLKALAAKDNNVPFYVALPSPTIDFNLDDGVKQIPVEQRDSTEVTHISGRTKAGKIETVEIVSTGSPAANYAFDVTPARLVTGLITERGVAEANEASIRALFPKS